MRRSSKKEIIKTYDKAVGNLRTILIVNLIVTILLGVGFIISICASLTAISNHMYILAAIFVNSVIRSILSFYHAQAVEKFNIYMDKYGEVLLDDDDDDEY